LKARLVPFAGFELPIQYTSIREEHTAVRERAGLFDVSHMGQIYFSGPKACEALERLLTCPVDSLKVGRARYGLLLNESAGCIDDVMLTREAEDLYFLCVNASNVETARQWIESQVGVEVGSTPRAESDLRVEDRSDQTALLALQGPAAKAILPKLGPDESELPRRFRVARLNLAGADTLVSGTGYTGSPGFELYVGNADAEKVFEAILEVGAADGVLPAGLGARDTLRLEAALALHGHELDDRTTPTEAGLDRFVKPLDSGFIGAEALAAEARSIAKDPNARSLIGFEMTERGIARADYEILSEGEVIGRVTSGSPSPTLGKSIGLGYVPRSKSDIGRVLAIRIRNKDVAAKIVERPFFKRPPA
jgi:aminomethyltransferase